jgi:hypothetical protein
MCSFILTDNDYDEEDVIIETVVQMTQLIMNTNKTMTTRQVIQIK